MNDAHMKASFELTGLQLVRGHAPGTPTTQAEVDAARALINGGGTGEKEHMPDRDATRYTFAGPPELMHPLTHALMQFIHEGDER